MTKRGGRAERPVKTTEHEIVFGSRESADGWRDLVATRRNALADAWSDLASNPIREDPRCHMLRGRLATIERAGRVHDQRQYELPGGARLWYYVDTDERRVVLLRAFTAHPNQTK